MKTNKNMTEATKVLPGESSRVHALRDRWRFARIEHKSDCKNISVRKLSGIQGIYKGGNAMCQIAESAILQKHLTPGHFVFME